MRYLFVILALVGFGAASAEPAPRVRKLAYEHELVWYLAGRLAHDLAEFQVRVGALPNDDRVSEHRVQYEILYHYYLVECGGPLPKLAEALRFSESAAAESSGWTIAHAGQMEYVIWPIVREWNGRILLQLLDRYVKGDYGFFPPCIAEGFKAQNPIPGVTTP